MPGWGGGVMKTKTKPQKKCAGFENEPEHRMKGPPKKQTSSDIPAKAEAKSGAVAK